MTTSPGMPPRKRRGAPTLTTEQLRHDVLEVAFKVRTNDEAQQALAEAVASLYERGFDRETANRWAQEFVTRLRERDGHDVLSLDGAQAIVNAMYSAKTSAAGSGADGASSEDTEAARDAAKDTKEDRLYGIAQRDLLLYKDSVGMFWAGIPQTDGSHTHVDLDSTRVSSFLHARYRRDFHHVVGSEAVRNALATIKGDLAETSETHDNYIRLAWHADTERLYVDLAGNKAAEIDATGWRVVTDAPVYFRRPLGWAPQAEPAPGGSLETLREILRVGDDRAWRLLVGFLLSAYHPTGPYPVLVLTGEQGSGKTTIATLLGQLIDPQKSQVQKAPTKEADVPVQASACHLLAWDNLSTVPSWFSDVLCGLATGLTETRRKLYSDANVYVFGATKPTLINGIEDLATRADLLSRALLVHLEAMPKDKRKELDAVYAAFEEARPALLGALFDAVSSALRNKNRMYVKHPPRMADMANWVTRAEPALGWEMGAYIHMFQANVAEAASISLEASPLGQGLLQWLKNHQRLHESHHEPLEYSEYASRFLDELNSSYYIDPAIRQRRGWPTLPHFFTGELRRIAPSLRSHGWNLRIDRDNQGAKVTLERLEGDAATVEGDTERDAAPEVVIVAEEPTTSGSAASRDAGDAGDAQRRTSSVPEQEEEEQQPHDGRRGQKAGVELHERHERHAEQVIEVDRQTGTTTVKPVPAEQQWTVIVPAAAPPCPTCGQPLGSAPLTCLECRAEVVWRTENARCRHQSGYTTQESADLPEGDRPRVCDTCGATFYCQFPDKHQTQWSPFGCTLCDEAAAHRVGDAETLFEELQAQAREQRLERERESSVCVVCGAPSWPYERCRPHIRLQEWDEDSPEAMQNGDPACEHVRIHEDGDERVICEDCGGVWECAHPDVYENAEGHQYSCAVCHYRWTPENTSVERLSEIAARAQASHQ